MVYSTRRFVVCLSVCHFVLAFFSPFSIATTSLGEDSANFNAFRTFVRFVLVWICRFSLPLGVWEGLPCVILFLCFSVLLVLRLPRLGKGELILVLFVRLFDLCLFVGFLFLLGSGKGCGLWLWHSLVFSLTFFCDCGTPWTFILPFFFNTNRSKPVGLTWP